MRFTRTTSITKKDGEDQFEDPRFIYYGKSLSNFNKPQCLYEVIYQKLKHKVYIDIDGKFTSLSEEEFKIKKKEIENKLKGMNNVVGILNGSKYNSKKGDFFSFHVTFNYYSEDTQLTKQYVKNVLSEKIKVELKEIIPIEWNNKKENVLGIDSSVYSKGRQLMRTIKAYKEEEPERIMKLVYGNEMDNLITFVSDDCPKLDYEYQEEKEKEKVIDNKIVDNNVKPKKRPFNESAIPTSQMRDLLMNFLKNDFVDWNIYFKIGSSLAHNGYEFNLFDNWCKLSKDYNKGCNNLLDWNSWVNSSNNVSIGIIVNILKQNQEQYKLYEEKYMKKLPIITLELLKLKTDLLSFLKPFLFEFMRYSNISKVWYVFNPNSCLWEVKANIRHCLLVYILNLIKVQIKKASSIGPDDEAEEIIKNKKAWGKAQTGVEASISSMEISCKGLLQDDKFIEKLDQKLGVIAFKNGLLDLETGVLMDITYEDYLTKTLSYDYKEGNEKDKQYILDELIKITNNDENHRNYLLSVLGYALLGYSWKIQEFWVMFGCGSNGKSLILEILTDIFENIYCVKGNTKMLDIKCGKSHKSLPTVTGARIAWFNELPKENNIDTELIKNFRDGRGVQNEILFGTETLLTIRSKMFIVSNHRVNFGKDGGINRSIRNISFNSQFLELEEDNLDSLKFKRDSDLCNKLVNLKYSFIEILMNHSQKFISKGLPKFPEEFEEDTKELIKQNDKFYNWLDNNYEPSNGGFVSIWDIVSQYPKDFESLEDKKKWIISEMKRLNLYKYNRRKMFNKKYGAFENIKKKTIVEDCFSWGSDSDEDEEMDLDS